jgi:Tfp pilus assembly protein PilF
MIRAAMRRKKRLVSKPDPVQAATWAENSPVQLFALVLIVFGAYWNSLDGGFHFDDQGIFLDSGIVSPGFGWKLLRLMQTRPLTFLSFHWNYLAGGHAPLGYHLVNVAIHAGNSALVMLIARFQMRGPMAWLAGALFALHPLQTQAVNYVFERATLLAALFALLSLLFFLQEKYWWSIAAFGISLLAKEETIALPVFLLFYEMVRRPQSIRWGRYAIMLALVALVALRLFYVLHTIPEAGLAFGTRGVSAIFYALTQCRVTWIYLRLFLFPVGLNLDHDPALSRNLLSPPTTLLAALLLMALVGGLSWLTSRRNICALWALGFFLLLAPSSSVIPVADLMFEHRCYFPLSCLTIATALLLEPLHWPFRTSTLVLALAALLVGTMERNRVWHDERSLWTDVVEKSPGKARGYFQLAQTYASEDPAYSRRLYERGLEIEPESPIGHTNLGVMLLSQGDAQGAMIELRKALQFGGEKPVVWNNMGAAQLRLGELDDGIKSFRHALESDPCRFDARWNLTHTLASSGQTDQALLVVNVPQNCHLLPEQIEKLERERRSLH